MFWRISAYSEICLKGRNDIIEHRWVEQDKFSYMYDVATVKPILIWIGFDDVRSLDFKVRYLMDNDFGGAMLFSLNYDDILEECFQHPFPLMRVISFHLNPRIQVEYPNPSKIFFIVNEKINAIRYIEDFGLMNFKTDNGNVT